ncbi:MAG: hypothetical protein ACRDP1_11955 [Nocardioidaceae bacterium]
MGGHTARRTTRSSLVPWRLVLAAAVAGCAVASTLVLGRGIGASEDGARTPHGSHHASAAAVTSDRWSPVLRRLDRGRDAALRTGERGRLASVYVTGSAVLERDRALLVALRRRGLALVNARLRVLAVRLLGVKHRQGLVWQVRLWVVDRLTDASVRLRSGSVVALPRDRPTARIVVLRHTRAGWRIAGARRLAG